MGQEGPRGGRLGEIARETYSASEEAKGKKTILLNQRCVTGELTGSYLQVGGPGNKEKAQGKLERKRQTGFTAGRR